MTIWGKGFNDPRMVYKCACMMDNIKLFLDPLYVFALIFIWRWLVIFDGMVNGQVLKHKVVWDLSLRFSQLNAYHDESLLVTKVAWL